MSGVICDKRVAAKVKGKVYKRVVRPIMFFGLDAVALTKRQEAELELAKLKMLRSSLRVTRVDSKYVGKLMLIMELPGKRQRGNPKSRFMNEVREDMQMREEDVDDRGRWRRVIGCDDA